MDKAEYIRKRKEILMRQAQIFKEKPEIGRYVKVKKIALWVLAAIIGFHGGVEVWLMFLMPGLCSFKSAWQLEAHSDIVCLCGPQSWHVNTVPGRNNGCDCESQIYVYANRAVICGHDPYGGAAPNNAAGVCPLSDGSS